MFDLNELRAMGFLRWPTETPGRITARFGDTDANTERPMPWAVGGHEGIDQSLPIGVPVKACAAGYVVESGMLQNSAGVVGSYGLRVAIDHDPPEGFMPEGWKIRTWYCHLSECNISRGNWVEKGQVIGLSGNTGSSTGPHLHLMVQFVPPLPPGLNERLRGVLDPLLVIKMPE